MKKTTHNFKKPLRSALAMALALVMTLSLTVQAFAAVGTWPATGTASGDRYLQNSGTFYNGSAVMAPKNSDFGGFINVYCIIRAYGLRFTRENNCIGAAFMLK